MKIAGSKLLQKVTAWALSLMLVLGMVCVPAQEVKADTITVNLNPDTSTKTVTASSNDNVEITFSVPDAYNTLKKVAAAGIKTLQVEYQVTSYTQSSAGTAGVMPFVSYGSEWTNGGVWQNLSTSTATVTLDLSAVSTTSTAAINSYGFQIANVTGSVTYQIKSAVLIGDTDNTDDDDDDDVVTDLEYNYAKLLQESLYLYDANMCGTDVTEKSGFTWRNDCHTDDQYVTYNGKTVDVSGGYHDAGDSVKFGLPQAYAASVLGMSYYQFEDAFTDLNLTSHYKRIMDRFVEYFKNCTVLDSSGNVEAFCYQVGDGNVDHSYWGPPENQASRKTEALFTSSSNTATDIVSETAAALAIYYCNFGGSEALSYAEKLFAYATDNSKMCLSNSFYASSSWEDDYALAAAWLYKATGKAKYKTYYNNTFGSRNYVGWVLSWDDVTSAALMYAPDNSGKLQYVANYINSTKTSVKDNNYCFISGWGSARYNCALQFMGLVYDDMKSSNTYGDWAESQMQYLLGNNDGKYCFVVGYNDYTVKCPHHRAASGYSDVNTYATTPLAHILVGSLVGGPDTESSSYVDAANNYATNEVALDYNAGLVGAAAGLYLNIMENGTNAEKALQKKAKESTLTDEIRIIDDEEEEECDHSYTKKVTKKATCTTKGVRTYTCSKCGDSYTESIAKLGHNYTTTTTAATMEANGSVVKKCSRCSDKTTTVIYKINTVKLGKNQFTYDGKNHKPVVNVKDSKGNVINNSNYTVTYATLGKMSGRHKVTIKFKGKYSGTVTRFFTVKPAKTTIAKVTAVNKGFTIKWNKNNSGVTGYQIQYANNNSFNNAKTVTVTGAAKVSKTINGLAKNKKFYVRVRAFKNIKVNGNTQKLFSVWSGTKNVTTK